MCMQRTMPDEGLGLFLPEPSPQAREVPEAARVDVVAVCTDVLVAAAAAGLEDGLGFYCLRVFGFMIRRALTTGAGSA